MFTRLLEATLINPKDMVKMKLYTKEELIEIFKDIKSRGWIESARQGNAGGVGNTLEDLYGIKENNLPTCVLVYVYTVDR